MRAISIDYQKKRKSLWVGWVLLAVPVLVGLDLIHTKMELEQQLAVWTGDRAASGRNPPQAGDGRQRKETPVSTQWEQAQEIFRQLTFPWSSLFRSLEKAHTDHVALLTVQPDIQRRALTIVGEAREYSEALGYVARLRQEASFTNVHLIGTEAKEDHPQRPLLFTVSANWKLSQ